MTAAGNGAETLSPRLIENYFRSLVNRVYKILPMREDGTESLGKYLWRLEAELIGSEGLSSDVREDAYYGSLLNVVHYLVGHWQECSVDQVRQLVFDGISLCVKLRERYAEGGG